MIHRSLLLAGVAVLALGGTPALANCADDIAALSGQSGSTVASGTTAGGAVSKDGSQAPLDQVEPATGAGAAATASGGTTAGETSGPAARAAGVATDDGTGGKVSKDGGDMPLSTDAATPSADQAMSQQDADAQQAGGTTAADQAAASGGQASMSGDVMAALNRARAAERAGDEAGCMQAIEEARSLQGG